MSRITFIVTHAISQQGMTLIIALIILLVLSLLGVTGVMNATFEERMARNNREYTVALQAAETALRDAEKELNPQSTNRLIFKAVGFKSDCSNGLCATSNLDWSKAVAYATNTKAGLNNMSALTTSGNGKVALQPKYLIEVIPDPLSCCNAATTRYIYRLTALGYGPTDNTQVILQEVYRQAGQ
jgi:type IV pilus assembly protein PilX